MEIPAWPTVGQLPNSGSVWESLDSSETKTLAEWQNSFTLRANPDGTITAEYRYTSGLPPMTLREVPLMRPFRSETREFSQEQVLIGCKDHHSVDYCEDCEVENNAKCGPCVAGWTKTDDPNMMCWKVGYRIVDCVNGVIFYAPLGYEQQPDGSHDGYCGSTPCTPPNCCGRQIDTRNRKGGKATGAVNSRHPSIVWKPAYGKPGYVKHYAGNYSWPRKGKMFSVDGIPVLGNYSKGWTNDGALWWETKHGKQGIRDTITNNCGGEVTWTRLTDEQANSVPGVLGEITMSDSPSIVNAPTTPTGTISTMSGNISAIDPGTGAAGGGTNWKLVGGVAIAAVAGTAILLRLRGNSEE